MAVLPSTSSDPAGPPATGPGAAAAEPSDPRLAFRSALARYQTARLAAIVQARGLETDAARPSTLATELTGHLDSPAVVAAVLAGLGRGSRMALSLFALTETSVWPFPGLCHALATLGIEPRPVILELLDRGLIALDAAPDLQPIEDFAGRIEQGPPHTLDLRVHPSVPQAVRVTRPEGKLTPVMGAVASIRESDALEPTLRLGAMWQRVGIEPLRQTQQGTLYKRDQDRIEGDPVLSGAISDALEPLPGISALWLALACRVGLIRRDSSGERLEAVGPDYWTENAVHLPQMIATSWLGLRTWSEWDLIRGERPEDGPPLPFLRPALMLWLACLGDDEWVALDDLDEHLRVQNPLWDRPTVRPDADGSSPGRRGTPSRGKPSPQVSAGSRGERVLRPLLLGAGYALGLVRTGEETGSGRTVVQLTALGRYVLALGPPPPPLSPFEHFLFVQPNLEIIAYRQGLSPQLVGRLSRFAWWTKIGAAMELKLTQESILLGLEGGQTPKQMIDILTRHSQRPLPPIVEDAIGRWASRRERITFYTAATLIEFNSVQDRDQAFEEWDANDPRTFIPVADRYLLVESPQRIPTDRIRTSGARDYRHPPEKCVSTESDGITLTLDISRSDLLVDAELGRFADELQDRPPGRGGSGAGVRRYLVGPASLARAADLGITSAQIADWFLRRTGEPPSPAIRLLLRSFASTPTNLTARRLLVLTTPTAEVADGLLQHPISRDLLGDRLGPTTVAVPEDRLESLRKALAELGLGFEVE